MTGEITLRGRVLPIGGLKEKILAAHRGGVKKVIIPKENEKDLKEVNDNILKDIEVVFADHMDEVLKDAIVSDVPILDQMDIPPPSTLQMGDEIGTNVN